MISRKDKTGKELYKIGVTVCGHSNCLILLPDDWEWDANTVGTGWQTEYSESTNVKWSTMEASGAVCLPAAGYGDGLFASTTDKFGVKGFVGSVGSVGHYWSSTPSAGNLVFTLSFESKNVKSADQSVRNLAYAVRLVTDVQ